MRLLGRSAAVAAALTPKPVRRENNGLSHSVRAPGPTAATVVEAAMVRNPESSCPALHAPGRQGSARRGRVVTSAGLSSEARGSDPFGGSVPAALHPHGHGAAPDGPCSGEPAIALVVTLMTGPFVADPPPPQPPPLPPLDPPTHTNWQQ